MVKVLEKQVAPFLIIQIKHAVASPRLMQDFGVKQKMSVKKFLKDFSGEEYICSPSASCVGFVRNYYEKLFEKFNPQTEVKDIKNRIYELSDFLVNVLHYTDFNASLDAVATYHDSCAALRECNLKQSRAFC
jgi:L-lactate dehydrogenase complex protein LldE